MSDSIKQILAISLLSVLLMAGCASNAPSNVDTNNSEQENDTNTVAVESNGSNSSSASETKNEEVRVSYKNGTYEGEGSYISPGGKEIVKVSMVVEDGMVKSMDLNVDTENKTSEKYKGLFKAGIDDLVMGKPLEEIEGFAQVNGSSLTPKGFQQAVEAIKSEAKA
jgi:uncharacterized protein YcfL